MLIKATEILEVTVNLSRGGTAYYLVINYVRWSFAAIKNYLNSQEVNTIEIYSLMCIDNSVG